MPHHFRITVDEDYVKMLGRAFYNFTYLEWGVAWLIAKLSPNGSKAIPRGRTADAKTFHKALDKAIKETSLSLEHEVHQQLEGVSRDFDVARKLRNKLLHAHPYTAEGGKQRLAHDDGFKWPIDEVESAAIQFESIATRCSELYNETLNN